MLGGVPVDVVYTERVLGKPGAKWMAFGAANGPISFRTCWMRFFRVSSSGSNPAGQAITSSKSNCRAALI